MDNSQVRETGLALLNANPQHREPTDLTGEILMAYAARIIFSRNLSCRQYS